MFALELYGKLKTQPGNLFFSPFSISTVLAMAWVGARGQTESEMARTLHFNADSEKVHADFSALVARMNGLQRPNRITLSVANSLWPQREYQLKKTFLDLIQSNYDAEAHSVDFRSQPQLACNSINQWIEEKTRRQIKSVIGPEQISADTLLVLCNAIYFKGAWETRFDPNKTAPQPFMISTNETVTVPMMHLQTKVKTAESDDGSAQLLELPYSGNDLSMLILLPRDSYGATDDDLSVLEGKLTAENLRTCLAKLDAASLHKTGISLPRFTTTQSFNLAKTLESMGMASTFGPAANFAGMDGTTDLFISDVLHKARVEVNEEGTEAAAATAVVMSRGMSAAFIVNRPFLFLIRDNGSGSILFLGRIVDPTK